MPFQSLLSRCMLLLIFIAAAHNITNVGQGAFLKLEIRAEEQTLSGENNSTNFVAAAHNITKVGQGAFSEQEIRAEEQIQRLQQRIKELEQKNKVQEDTIESLQLQTLSGENNSTNFVAAAHNITNVGQGAFLKQEIRAEEQTLSGENNSTKEYFCLTDLWAGNCNRILEMARALKLAKKKNLELALLSNYITKRHKVREDSQSWFRSLFDPSPRITLPSPNVAVNCKENITGRTAYYTDFAYGQSNPFLFEIGELLIPNRTIREEAEKAVKERYGNKPFLSVHRRGMNGCIPRALNGKTLGRDYPNNCTTQTALTMCYLNYTTVQQHFNPTNLPVLLFTDGMRKELDSTFPVISDEDFFVQMWMMTLSERHVGTPVSSVDLIVNHWRYSRGNPNIMPSECYHDFQQEYVRTDNKSSIFDVGRPPAAAHNITKVGQGAFLKQEIRAEEQTLSGENNSTKEYFCLTDLWAGNCNRILEMARALKLAKKKNLELALLNNYITKRKGKRKGEVVEDSQSWFRSLFDPSPRITLPSPNVTVNCKKNITGRTAYYTDFAYGRSNPFLFEIGELLIPNRTIREEAEKAVKERYGNKPFLSVHRRGMNGCIPRALHGKTLGRDYPNNCTTQTALTMCYLNYTTVQQHFNPTNLPVLLFTDGMRKELDSTFPVISDEDFFVQMWMMTLSERHVGNPVSSVDLIVSHWRYSRGNPNIMPSECYHDFQQEYVRTGNKSSIFDVGRPPA